MKIQKLSDICDCKLGLFLNVADKEILKVLAANNVRYVVIGGHAVNYYGYDRPTADLDIVIDRVPENVERLLSALSNMRMSVPTNALEILTKPNKKMQIPLYEIDILTSIDGLQFDDMFNDWMVLELDTLQISMISKAHLLFMKQHSDREEDRRDCRALDKIQRGD
jgi:predicted nucleotidyltransferase